MRRTVAGYQSAKHEQTFTPSFGYGNQTGPIILIELRQMVLRFPQLSPRGLTGREPPPRSELAAPSPGAAFFCAPLFRSPPAVP